MFRCAVPGHVSAVYEAAGLHDVTEWDVGVKLVTSSPAEFWETMSEHVSIRSPQDGEVLPDVAQVRPLLLQDHAHAVTKSEMPVSAAPRVVALLGEQLRRGRSQEVGSPDAIDGSTSMMVTTEPPVERSAITQTPVNRQHAGTACFGFRCADRVPTALCSARRRPRADVRT